jgi:gamma-glutamyltranspeptidase
MKMLLSQAILLSFGLFNGVALASPLKEATAKTGAVASESKVCSTIGADVLKEGGNAADAVS